MLYVILATVAVAAVLFFFLRDDALGRPNERSPNDPIDEKSEK